MGIFRRKIRASAEEIAQALFQEFISTDNVPTHPIIASEQRSSYQQKMFLYRFATVLMVLLSEEQNNPKFSDVIPIVESYSYPPSPAEEGLLLMTRVKNAMLDLRSLVTGADRPTITEIMTQQKDPNRGVNQAPEFSFAWAWLHDIGIDESNPATLSLLALRWMDTFIMITKVIKNFRPV